jgi:hypothetical protein
MTTRTQPTARRPVTQRAAGHINRDHTVVGTVDQLANIVDNHLNAGTLVAMTAPRPVGDRFQMTIRIREDQTTRVTSTSGYTRIRRSRRTRIAVIATTVTGTVAGLVAVAAYLIGQLVELIAAHAAQILGVLALAAILATAVARRSTSGRRHCPGC